MVAAAKAPASGCPLTALKGALCTRPYVKYIALAAAGGVLAYLIYAYAASADNASAPPPAVEEPKAESAQKSPKKGGKSKRKKRRFSSATKPFGGSSGSELSTSSGKGRPLHPADSRRKSSTPRK